MSCEVEAAASAGSGPSTRLKKSVVRKPPDRSFRLRTAVQAAFLLLNIWIGVEFYLFVRYFETEGAWPRIERPPGVEGWLPIASLMNLKVLLATGRAPEIHPAGVFILIACMAISLLLRKAFCSWLCPIGTLSEWLWRSGRKLWRRSYRLPHWADLGLRSSKYILAGLFLYAIAGMSVEAIEAFMHSPYGLIADVKMLNFFRYLSTTAAIVLGILTVASLFLQNFWCRYFCPYGALLGLLSCLSPVKVRRDPETCVDCAKCARACPNLLPVDRLLTVRSAECTGCYECVAACPVEGALWMSAAGGRRQLHPWAMVAAVAVLFLAVTGIARLTGHWQTRVSDEMYRLLIPRAHLFTHP